MSCPTSNHDKEPEYFDGIPVHTPEAIKDYWYKRYMNVLWENEALKKQLIELKLSRIDLIALNGNEGTHYDETT